MAGLRAAIGFLTVLPVRVRGEDGLAASRMWFPVVGLLLGGSLAAADLLLRAGIRAGQGGPAALHGGPLIPLLLGTILVALLAVLTRGLHLDGFMDTCDALLGGFDPRRRLDILRDPHVGAFGVAGAVCLLLSKAITIGSLPVGSRTWVILVVPCISRWAVLLVMGRFPYVRSEGLGAPFVRAGGAARATIVGLAVTGAAVAALAGSLGLVLVAAGALVALGVGAWATRLLGGVTGDIFGAVVESTEVIMLVLAVFLTLGDGAALSPPPFAGM